MIPLAFVSRKVSSAILINIPLHPPPFLTRTFLKENKIEQLLSRSSKPDPQSFVLAGLCLGTALTQRNSAQVCAEVFCFCFYFSDGQNNHANYKYLTGAPQRAKRFGCLFKRGRLMIFFFNIYFCGFRAELCFCYSPHHPRRTASSSPGTNGGPEGAGPGSPLQPHPPPVPGASRPAAGGGRPVPRWGAAGARSRGEEGTGQALVAAGTRLGCNLAADRLVSPFCRVFHKHRTVGLLTYKLPAPCDTRFALLYCLFRSPHPGCWPYACLARSGAGRVPGSHGGDPGHGWGWGCGWGCPAPCRDPARGTPRRGEEGGKWQGLRKRLDPCYQRPLFSPSVFKME